MWEDTVMSLLPIPSSLKVQSQLTRKRCNRLENSVLCEISEIASLYESIGLGLFPFDSYKRLIPSKEKREGKRVVFNPYFRSQEVEGERTGREGTVQQLKVRGCDDRTEDLHALCMTMGRVEKDTKGRRSESSFSSSGYPLIPIADPCLSGREEHLYPTDGGFQTRSKCSFVQNEEFQSWSACFHPLQLVRRGVTFPRLHLSCAYDFFPYRWPSCVLSSSTSRVQSDSLDGNGCHADSWTFYHFEMCWRKKRKIKTMMKEEVAIGRIGEKCNLLTDLNWLHFRRRSRWSQAKGEDNRYQSFLPTLSGEKQKSVELHKNSRQPVIP